MKKIKIISDVVDFKLKRNRRLISDAIKGFNGKTIEITIEKFRKKRSNDQNAYLWGVVYPIAQEGLRDIGEIRSIDSIHYQICLPLFAPVRDIVNNKTGEVFEEKITSSEMTTTEFMEYKDSIQKWAAEFLGIDIPDPNEELSLL